MLINLNVMSTQTFYQKHYATLYV